VDTRQIATRPLADATSIGFGNARRPAWSATTPVAPLIPLEPLSINRVAVLRMVHVGLVVEDLAAAI
jgi:hypothetical protein